MEAFDVLLCLVRYGASMCRTLPSDKVQDIDGIRGRLADEAFCRELMALAEKHSVSGLMIDGVNSLYEDAGAGPALPRPVVKWMAQKQEEVETDCERVDDTLDKLLALFCDAGLHPVNLKGPSVAALYPVPHHRASGDIDLFFDGVEFGRALNVLRNAGVEAQMSADGSAHYFCNAVFVEHHPLFYDCSRQFEGIDWRSPEAMMLLLSTHILKHCLGKGVALKQVIDYEVAARALDYDRNRVLCLMDEAGMGKWQRLLEAFCKISDEGCSGTDACRKRAECAEDLKKVIVSYRRQNREKKKLRRKAAVFALFLRKFPFGMRYAPREWFYNVRLLLHGNRK